MPHAVILVDELDQEVGQREKLAAHREGALHRAVSVFAFDAAGDLIMQRRAPGKYHSGGLWSNSACTHPRAGESVDAAARRCMREELGVPCASLVEMFSFIYRAQVSPSLVEHEFDHVLVATVHGALSPDPDEVEDVRHVSLPDAWREVSESPERFTAWFPLALTRLRALGGQLPAPETAR
ncbi:MAG: isopentenyl-diphosphate Delta-isomerase [Gemmatimonadaceae bacterium]